MAAAAVEGVQVAVRVRPLTVDERTNLRVRNTIRCLDRSLVVDRSEALDSSNASRYYGARHAKPKPQQFNVHHVFHAQCSQLDVFSSSCSAVVRGALEGINGSILAYGATGSGKTHTIFGGEISAPGVVYQSVQELFDEKLRLEQEEGKQVQLLCSFVEVYNEDVFDLLRADRVPLAVQVGGGGDAESLNIKGLIKKEPVDIDDFATVVAEGQRHRSTGTTLANAQSSRSHAIITIDIEVRDGNDVSKFTTSRLRFCDLAGSERAASVSTKSSERFKEGANINKSLLALDAVVQSLAKKQQEKVPGTTAGAQRFIPYRGSKLTRLLQDCLGGNCRTVMLFCVSPSSLHIEETLRTMQFAMRAKEIQVNARRNEHNVNAHSFAVEQERLIERLRLQYALARQVLQRRGGGPAALEELDALIAEELGADHGSSMLLQRMPSSSRSAIHPQHPPRVLDASPQPASSSLVQPPAPAHQNSTTTFQASCLLPPSPLNNNNSDETTHDGESPQKGDSSSCSFLHGADLSIALTAAAAPARMFGSPSPLHSSRGVTPLTRGSTPAAAAAANAPSSSSSAFLLAPYEELKSQINRLVDRQNELNRSIADLERKDISSECSLRKEYRIQAVSLGKAKVHMMDDATTGSGGDPTMGFHFVKSQETVRRLLAERETWAKERERIEQDVVQVDAELEGLRQAQQSRRQDFVTEMVLDLGRLRSEFPKVESFAGYYHELHQVSHVATVEEFEASLEMLVTNLRQLLRKVPEGSMEHRQGMFALALATLPKSGTQEMLATFRSALEDMSVVSESLMSARRPAVGDHQVAAQRRSHQSTTTQSAASGGNHPVVTTSNSSTLRRSTGPSASPGASFSRTNTTTSSLMAASPAALQVGRRNNLHGPAGGSSSSSATFTVQRTSQLSGGAHHNSSSSSTTAANKTGSHHVVPLSSAATATGAAAGSSITGGGGSKLGNGGVIGSYAAISGGGASSSNSTGNSSSTSSHHNVSFSRSLAAISFPSKGKAAPSASSNAAASSSLPVQNQPGGAGGYLEAFLSRRVHTAPAASTTASQPQPHQHSNSCPPPPHHSSMNSSASVGSPSTRSPTSESPRAGAVVVSFSAPSEQLCPSDHKVDDVTVAKKEAVEKAEACET